MNPDNTHTPFTPVNEQDPQIIALFNNLFHERITEMEKLFTRELTIRDEALQLEKQQAEARQTELENLQHQLATIQARSGYIYSNFHTNFYVLTQICSQ